MILFVGHFADLLSKIFDPHVEQVWVYNFIWKCIIFHIDSFNLFLFESASSIEALQLAQIGQAPQATHLHRKNGSQGVNHQNTSTSIWLSNHNKGLLFYPSHLGFAPSPIYLFVFNWTLVGGLTRHHLHYQTMTLLTLVVLVIDM